MQSNELLSIIARVRRAMPRNKDVMDVCKAAEKFATKPITLEQTGLTASNIIQQAKKPIADNDRIPGDLNGKFDKKAYQREYMRARRAKRK